MTKRLRVSPDLALPDDAVTQTFVVFGKRGSGKSNTAVVLAEEMHRAGGQIIVLDPVGAWWGLKSSFDGTGPGLPVYIFGGQHGDLPLQPTKGELMAQVAIAHRIPMVLDMTGWAGAERARFVTAFAKWLLAHNDRTPVHVFLEEADAFIPQRPYKGEEEMLGSMDRLIRWGRQEGIGATAITQRSAKINKDVTTQAEVLVAHRTIGPQDVAAIREWIKYHAAGDEQQQVLASLPTLPDGEAWVWSPDWLDLLERIPFRRRETFDSASTPKLGEKRIQPKQLAPVDVERLRDQMDETIEQQKANDPAELRRQIAALKRELEKSSSSVRVETVVETVEKIVEVPVLNGQVEALTERAERLQDVGASVMAVGRDILAAIGRVQSTPMLREREERAPRGVPARPASDRGDTAVATLAPAAPRRDPAPASDGEGRQLKAGARRMLSALAQLHPTPLSRPQLGTLADVTPGGTFSSYLSSLSTAGLVEETGGRIALTAAGQDAVAGELGTGAPAVDELVGMWGRKLKAGARRMLDVLVAEYPGGLSKADLADRAGVVPGGTLSSYLSSLRRNGLLDESGGELRAGAALFLGAAR
jgi:Helicase HerA, central domain